MSWKYPTEQFRTQEFANIPGRDQVSGGESVSSLHATFVVTFPWERVKSDDCFKRLTYDCTNVVKLFSSGSRMTLTVFDKGEKGRGLTPCYEKAPAPTEKSKKQRENTKTLPKTSNTQRLRTDLRRSVEITIVTQLVWLNWFTGSQPSH